MHTPIRTIIEERGEVVSRAASYIRAHWSDVFSTRQIYPEGAWKVHIWRGGEEQASLTLYLTDEERDMLIHQLTDHTDWTEEARKAWRHLPD